MFTTANDPLFPSFAMLRIKLRFLRSAAMRERLRDPALYDERAHTFYQAAAYEMRFGLAGEVRTLFTDPQYEFRDLGPKMLWHTVLAGCQDIDADIFSGRYQAQVLHPTPEERRLVIAMGNYLVFTEGEQVQLVVQFGQLHNWDPVRNVGYGFRRLPGENWTVRGPRKPDSFHF